MDFLESNPPGSDYALPIADLVRDFGYDFSSFADQIEVVYPADSITDLSRREPGTPLVSGLDTSVGEKDVGESSVPFGRVTLVGEKNVGGNAQAVEASVGKRVENAGGGETEKVGDVPSGKVSEKVGETVGEIGESDAPAEVIEHGGRDDPVVKDLGPNVEGVVVPS